MKLIISLLTLFCFSAKANILLDLESEIGQGYFGSNFGLSQSLDTYDNQLYLSQWNISAGANQSKYEDSTTGELFITRGRQGSLGAGLGYDNNWNLDLSLYSSSTSETNYSENGSFLQGSYVKRNMVQSDHEFGFGFGLGVGSSKIGQKISFKIGQFNINRDVELEKSEKSVFVSISAFSSLFLKMEYQTYSYSRSKSDLQTAYRNRFLNYYTSDLINSIGGLPDYSASLFLNWAYSELWDFSMSARKTHLIVDDSEAKRYQAYADRFFDNWSAGIGFSRSETSQSYEGSFLARGSINF